MPIKSYHELITLPTYGDRFSYLQLFDNNPGNKHRNTIMQRFLKSHEWKTARRNAIIRDFGYDLGIQDDWFKIGESDNPDEKGPILVHHINPITEWDIINHDPKCYDLDNLITVSKITHNKIHYRETEIYEYVERKPGDTSLSNPEVKLWK